MILKLSEDKQTAYFDGNTMSYRSMIKAIPGNDWNKKKRQWTIPIASIEDVKRIWPDIQVATEVLKI